MQARITSNTLCILLASSLCYNCFTNAKEANSKPLLDQNFSMLSEI